MKEKSALGEEKVIKRVDRADAIAAASKAASTKD
jgi:hypothetical protein